MTVFTVLSRQSLTADEGEADRNVVLRPASPKMRLPSQPKDTAAQQHFGCIIEGRSQDFRKMVSPLNLQLFSMGC
jgi:hypothetical protein